MGRLSAIAVNDEGFLFDPSTGESFVCNRTGLAILRMLKDGKDAPAIADALAELFDVDAGRALRDAQDFVDKLRSWRLS